MLEAFLQLSSSQKGRHCPYLLPPRAARSAEASFCGSPPVLRPVPACLHSSQQKQPRSGLGAAARSHAHPPAMPRATASGKPGGRTLLPLEVRRTLWAGIHSGSSKLTLWRMQGDSEGKEKVNFIASFFKKNNSG